MTDFANALVIGGDGAIGSALARALADAGTRVTALSRRSDPPVDLEQEDGIAAAATALQPKAPFDLVLVATGILHGEGVRPERRLADIAPDAMARYFAVNATGPMLVARHVLPLMPRDRRAVFACLSARVGSIGDNRLGGWYGYRASKAALTMLVRTLGIETARTHPQMVVAALHPGTVDSPLSEPFRRNLAPGQLTPPGQAAASLLSVLHRLGPGDSGGHFDWRGDPVPP